MCYANFLQDLKLGVAGGQIETAGRFFEPSEEESERMVAETTNASRADLSAHTKTSFWACARSSLRPRTPTFLLRPTLCGTVATAAWLTSPLCRLLPLEGGT